MKVLFLDAPYSGPVELCQETLDYVKKFKKVALYASVQFVSKLEKVEEQLKEIGVEFVTSKADRTSVKSQLLGCDSYHDSLRLEEEFDAYLYIGDGKFHPLALVYGQKDNKTMKEIIRNDPLQEKMFLMGIEEIQTILRKYKGSLVKFLSSHNIGVIVTIKPGQEQFRPALALEDKFPEKKFYYFIDNNVSFDHLENFNFIDTWINTTCPRVGFDDQEKFRKGVVNLNDAFLAAEILTKDSLLNKI
ncbi:diphthamide synthesis protein [Candidatus Woesearchaeota archaeon]|nr:diphthamide synthesis protein [Candidatus Woesearchaeota archaeon]